MEEDLTNAVPCSSLAVESVIRFGTAGALWGFCSAPYDARNNGLTGIAHASFVAKSVGKFSFQYGLLACLYSMTQCGLQKYRRQNDWKNSLIAGAVAGAAISAGTRSNSSKTQVIGTAFIVSVFGAAAYISRTNGMS